MFAELRKLLRSGAIRRHQLWAKYLFTLVSSVFQYPRITSPLSLAATASCVRDLNPVFSSMIFTYLRTVQIEKFSVFAISSSVSPPVSSRSTFNSPSVNSVLNASPTFRTGVSYRYTDSPAIVRSSTENRLFSSGSLYQKLSIPASLARCIKSHSG